MIDWYPYDWYSIYKEMLKQSSISPKQYGEMLNEKKRRVRKKTAKPSRSGG